MSQPTSSIVSHDNPEIKYKKALKEISKLIQANRTLRESSEKITRELNEKINELSLRYQDLVREYESVRKEKESLSNYLDEIQENDSEFRKERNNLDREVAYLNDIVQENSAELKKLKMHKDEQAVSNLIRAYEEKEITMNRNRTQNEEIITSLKSAYERLENEFQTERNEKQEYEDRYKVLSLEMNRYKEQNATLLEQIERLLRESYQKESYCIEKEKQLRLLVSEFQKQVTILKSGQEESYSASKDKSFQDQIEELQTQKNRVEIEFKKLENAYEVLTLREKEYYEMEEKMKHAKLQAERANDEINMLKSKIIVLEAKEFLEEAGDQDYDQNEFEEKLNLLVSQNDPIHTIRNQEDSSHFKILKGFIVDLQDKVIKLTTQREEMRKKYKSMKTKFVKNAEEADYYEEQNKLMKTKLEGYERLSQKLQYELENSISAHEEAIARMTATSNNIITKRVEEYKATIAVLSSQLEMNQGKFDRSEKNLKQQIETLKLELDTYKMKFIEESDKSAKDNGLLDLYKNKNIEISTRINVLEELLSNNNDNLNRFEELYKEEKGKNEALLLEKQQLILQVKQFGELASINTGIREEKEKNVRFSHEFHVLKAGKDIEQELIGQNRRRE